MEPDATTCLPTEVLEHILSFLATLADRHAARLVSQRFLAVSRSTRYVPLSIPVRWEWRTEGAHIWLFFHETPYGPMHRQRIDLKQVAYQRAEAVASLAGIYRPFVAVMNDNGELGFPWCHADLALFLPLEVHTTAHFLNNNENEYIRFEDGGFQFSVRNRRPSFPTAPTTIISTRVFAEIKFAWEYTMAIVPFDFEWTTPSNLVRQLLRVIATYLEQALGRTDNAAVAVRWRRYADTYPSGLIEALYHWTPLAKPAFQVDAKDSLRLMNDGRVEILKKDGAATPIVRRYY